MRWRLLSLCLAIISFLLASYFAWARHRISGPVIFREARIDNPNWPRKWPYPDEWLLQWHDQISAEQPVYPGGIRIHGELPRLEMKLLGWIVVSGLVGISLLVFGIRLVPYASFSLSTPEPTTRFLERLSDVINGAAELKYYGGTVWDSGFKLMKFGAFHKNCPIVFCGRFESWSGGAGTEINVKARLFRPLLWFLFLWFGILVSAIAILVAKIESDSGQHGTTRILLNSLTAVVGMALLSWAVIVAWFRISGRKSFVEVTALLSMACSPGEMSISDQRTG